MKNLKRIYFLIACCLVLMMGCKKYLDQKSNDSLVVPKTLKDIQGILDDAATMNLKVTPSYNEHSSDDFFMLQGSYNELFADYRNVYVWKPTIYTHQNDYALGYTAIFNSNLSLDLLKNVERNTSNALAWDQIKGSALFFRSYYFLMLNAQFGLAYDEARSRSEPGIPLRLDTEFGNASIRASVAECYQQVITDLTAALPLLPAYPQQVMRPSKGAVLALLSRCYLYMHNYGQALKYADDALIYNNKLMNFNGDADLLALSSASPIKKFNKETIWYAEMSYGFGINTSSRGTVDSTLYGSYASNDLRRTAYFKAVGSYQQFKGNYTASSSIYFSGLATDELYLTRAECRAYLDNVQGAMDDLNFLLISRWKNTQPYIAITAVDKTDAVNRVRLERRKELLYRGLRWGDIKRYNKEGANIVLKRVINGETFTLLPNSNAYALSLPDDIIRLTGMPQN